MQIGAARARRLWLWMIPLLLLVVALCLVNVDANPLWGDERFTVSSTGGVFSPIYTLPEVWESVAVGHVQHLPGYMLLMNLWIRLAGAEPAAMRYLSLFLGLIGIAWTYRLARRIAPGTPAGLYAAAILGTSMLMTNYMIVVRMYTLLVALTAFVIDTYLGIVFSRREPSGWRWLGLAVGTVALIYTHYLGMLTLVALGVLHLALLPAARRRGWMRRWWTIAAPVGAAGLLFLPWLPHLLNGLRVEAANRPGGSFNLVATLGLFARAFGNSFAVLAIVSAVVVLFARGRRARRLLLLAAATALSMLVYFAVSNRLNSGHTAYLIGIWPVFVALLGVVIESWVRRGGVPRVGALALLAALVVSGVYAVAAHEMTFMIDRHRYLFPVHSVDAALRVSDLPGEHVAIALPDGLSDIDYRSSRIAVEDQRVDIKLTSYVTYGGPRDNSIERAEAAGRYDFARWPRVWAAYDASRATGSRADFDQAVAGTFAECPQSLALGRVRLDQYAQNPVCCIDASRQSLARFGGGIGLDAVDVHNGGAALDVVQNWSVGADVPANTYSISMQLWNASGEKVAQQDYGLEASAHPCLETQLDVSGLAAGAYSVMLTVYDWHNGQRLAGTLGSAAPTTDLLPVGSVTLP